MTNQSFVLLSALAAEFKREQSNVRKYILKHGFSFLRVRSPESGQLVLALTSEDAESLRELRQAEGYGIGDNDPVDGGVLQGDTSHGWFYIVQVVPDLDPHRLKMGFATDTARRLDAYRTLSPTAHILKVWPCRMSWEKAAMDSLTRLDCKALGGEVFDSTDLDALLNRGDQFFALMPSS